MSDKLVRALQALETAASQRRPSCATLMNVRGAGTGRIEQLSSVAARLAEELCLPFISVYRDGLYPLFDRRLSAARRITLPSRLVIESIGNTASEWTAALATITKLKSLRCCSLLPFQGALAARRLVTTGRRWCPECLEQMADGGEIYEPLVWRIAEVYVCPLHDRRLADTCHRCGKGGQTSLVANARVGCCRYCGAWLGRRERDVEGTPIDDFATFCAWECEEILLLPQTLPKGEEILPSDISVTGLRDVFFSGNGSSMARRLGEVPSQLNAYCTGQLPTPLHVYLRASYLTGASMRQIFVTQEFNDALPRHQDAEFGLRRARSRAAYEQERVDNELRLAIAGEGDVSVRQVATRLNIDPPTLWRRSAELANELARKHAKYSAQRSVAKKASFVEQARTVIQTYQIQDTEPTWKEIMHGLDDPGVGLNPWKRSVIRELMAEAFSTGEASIGNSAKGGSGEP